MSPARVQVEVLLPILGSNVNLTAKGHPPRRNSIDVLAVVKRGMLGGGRISNRTEVC